MSAESKKVGPVPPALATARRSVEMMGKVNALLRDESEGKDTKIRELRAKNKELRAEVKALKASAADKCGE